MNITHSFGRLHGYWQKKHGSSVAELPRARRERSAAAAAPGKRALGTEAVKGGLLHCSSHKLHQSRSAVRSCSSAEPLCRENDEGCPCLSESIFLLLLHLWAYMKRTEQKRGRETQRSRIATCMSSTILCGNPPPKQTGNNQSNSWQIIYWQLLYLRCLLWAFLCLYNSNETLLLD